MGRVTKEGKNRTKMSQMKDKNSPHTKRHWNGVELEDPGFVQLANR